MSLLFGGISVIGAAMLLAPDAELGVRLTGLVVLVGGVLLTRSAWLAGVWVTDEGLVVRHWIRKEHLRWKDVSRFSVGSGTNVLPTHTLHVHLSDGRDVRVQAVSASAVVHRERSFVHDAVERLETERQKRLNGPGAS